jgi:hypothetical protein
VEIEALLDFAMVLAISNSPYEEYDAKSKKFIIDTLDFIEDQFKGYSSIEQETNGKVKQKVTLNYFESIKSENKTFNKMMVVKTAPDLDSDKMFKLVPGSSLKPFENKKKKIVSSSSEEEILSESEEEEVSLAQEIIPKPADEIIEEDMASDSESEEEVEFLDVEAGLLSGDSDIEVVEEVNDTTPDSKKPLASYDFKSKEGRFSEEFAYQNSRKKRLG